MASLQAPPNALDQQLASLKDELERHDSHVFEQLSAHLISRLLGDVAITVSKSGYQIGGDAGTAGLRGRRLRIECKRYQESTALNSRGLAGEVAEAADDDELLEAWILMATKAVKDNERRLAFRQGQKQGVPVIVIDWTPPARGAGLCALAALCASWPEVVEQHLGIPAATAARALTPHVGAAVDNLRKDLAVWDIGFKQLREVSHRHLMSIWESRRQCWAYMGQDAAGGEPGVALIARNGPLRELTGWWSDPAQLDAPAIVTGLEGVGKTWAALDWTRQSCDHLPIILLVPAGTFASGHDVSVGGIQHLLAESLRKSTKSTLSIGYWQTRVARLLARPIIEGPTFFLWVDGLNQSPQTQWRNFAHALQAAELVKRVRVLMTSRQSYFEQDLTALSSLDPAPRQIKVGVYDDAEFDEVLRLHGMSRDKLHESLRLLARTPRLFPIVYRLKDNPALKSDASVHRLLFEYGREVLTQRGGSAFTPDAWLQWLSDRARHHREQIKGRGALTWPEPAKDLALTLASPTLTPEDVKRRLSDVVDGHWGDKKQVGAAHQFVLRPEVAILGLALALLEVLDQANDDGRQSALEEWLEPVAAVDHTTEVLRAALSVISAGLSSDGEVKTDCLLVTWMNAQNHGRTFPQDVKIFGDAFPRSMLVVVERSLTQAARAARQLAIQSLRRLPRTRTADWKVIEARLIDWAGRLCVPRPENIADKSHYAKRHHERIVERIGTADPGKVIVLGTSLALAYEDGADLTSAIAGTLEGHDLTQFPALFSTCAVRAAVDVTGSDHGATGLHWLASVGSADEQATQQFLSRLADDMLARAPEPHVHPRLANRAAAWLLRLSGDEAMERRASVVNETFGAGSTYQERYEKDPANSMVAPERRHLEMILEAADLPVWRRLDKAANFLADPTVQLPTAVIDHLESMLDGETFDGVRKGMHQTAEDHRWEKMQPAAARYLPEKFVEASRRQLKTLAARSGDHKYWSALQLMELMLLVQPEDAPLIADLRTASSLERHDDVTNTWCLQLELLHLPIEQQLDRMLEACDYSGTLELFDVLRPASAEQLERFLERHQRSAAAEGIVLRVMAAQRPSGANQLAQALLHNLASEQADTKDIAFMALSLCAPDICGQHLLSTNWKADAAEAFASHYGSDAIAHASTSFGLDEVRALIAPWRWLHAAVVRGGEPAELQFVSAHLVRVILGAGMDIPALPGEWSMYRPTRGLANIGFAEKEQVDQSAEAFFKRSAESIEDVNRRLEEVSRLGTAALRKIRASGYSLYLHAFEVSEVREAYRCAPLEWEKLLEGAQQRTESFVRRVRSAEGLYMALCEVLLELAPAHGAILWDALPNAVLTKMKGAAGISEFVHMIFRAPDSPEIEKLRRSLISFASTSTDVALLDLVIAAQFNGRDEWLQSVIKEDQASRFLWRHKRALTLEGFSAAADAQSLNWPSGPKTTSVEALVSSAIQWRNRRALARLWWVKFTQASDAGAAFAAWHVFLKCADRRAYVWMKVSATGTVVVSELDRLRALHVQMNRSQLDRALAAAERKPNGLKDCLFGREAPANWLEMDGIAG